MDSWHCNGQPLAVPGCVNIRLRCLDGAARLPEISVCAFVVRDLHVVNAVVLTGVDVVAGSQGLHLEYQENKIFPNSVWPSDTYRCERSRHPPDS